MLLDEAFATFGLGRDTSFAEVRRAYRVAMRACHPDVRASQPAVDDNAEDQARRYNAAFAVIEAAQRDETLATEAPRAAYNTEAKRDIGCDIGPDDDGEPIDIVRTDDDALALIAPADEVFVRLARSLDALGELTDADQNAWYLEALVCEGHGRLTVNLQGRSEATEAFFTLESLDGYPLPSLESVVRTIAAHVRGAYE